jgi:chromosome segregation ATPase
MLTTRTQIESLAERVLQLEREGAGARHQHALEELEVRIRAVEEATNTLLTHVKSCEELQIEASKQRNQLRRELRQYAAAIITAIIVSIAVSWLHQHGVSAA